MPRPLCSSLPALALGLLVVVPALGQPQPGAPAGPAPAPRPTGTGTVPKPPAPKPPATAEPPAPEPAPVLGGPGESCRARADCEEGLRCLNLVCTDPMLGESCGAAADCGGRLRCIENVCGGPQPGQPPKKPAPAPAPKPAPPADDEDEDKEEAEEAEEEDSGGGVDEWIAHPMFEGVGGFVGLAVMGGVGWIALLEGGAPVDVKGSFLMGLRGGLLIDRIELGLELSPFTFLPYTASGAAPTFQANATFGYHIRMSDMLSWPVRAGVGLAAGNNLMATGPLFQARADLLGLSVNYGHLLFDAHFPTFRFLTEFDRVAVMDWLVGGGASYAF